MHIRTIKTTVELYASIDELPAAEQALVLAAKAASGTSYAPYSHFHVGAALLLGNGEVVSGSNQENIASPSGLCAERTVLFYAGARFPTTSIRAIAIAAQANGQPCAMPVYPCGACRQVLLESEQRGGVPIRVIMVGEKKIEVLNSAYDLLPLTFGQNQAYTQHPDLR
jgi:cytidine deaminase